MNLPFTTDAFFEVFARYNLATWPVVVALWVAAAGAVAAVARRPGARSSRLASAVLAVLWLWGGVVCHVAYFTSINPAAWGFAALFVAEAGLLAWYGVVQRRLALGDGHGLVVEGGSVPGSRCTPCLLRAECRRRPRLPGPTVLRRAVSDGHFHRGPLARDGESPALAWSWCPRCGR